jgi:cytochrome c
MNERGHSIPNGNYREAMLQSIFQRNGCRFASNTICLHRMHFAETFLQSVARDKSWISLILFVSAWRSLRIVAHCCSCTTPKCTATKHGSSRSAACRRCRPRPEETPRQSLSTAEERGRQYFLGACANCHSLEGDVGIGPPLNGVIGRRVAAIPKFAYSTALASRHDVWTDSLIQSFIVNPGGVMPATAMSSTGLAEFHAEDIAAYLKTTRGSNE